MKRLIELPPDDRLIARAHVLVRATGSTVESDERRARVRRSLDAPTPKAGRGWALRLTLATALLGVSAVAVAGPGRLWSAIVSTTPPLRPPASPTSGAAPGARPRALDRAPQRESAAMVVDSTAGEVAVAPPPPPRERGPSTRAATSGADSDVTRVHEAAKALRRDGNPRRALELLEGKPVGGPLAEEALALRIEASAARKDGRAAQLAAAYLARFPNGRYRELAKSAASGRAP